MGLFLFAMFALVAASAVSKMTGDNEEVPKPVDQAHTLTSAAGLTAFTVGLTLLALTVRKWMIVPVTLGFLALIISFKRAHDDLLP